MKRFYSLVLGLFLLVAAANAQTKSPQESAMDRFLRYVKIDTQSAEDQATVPSTKKQFNLANLLAKELKDLGAKDVRVSEFAIVYAMLPGNLADNSTVPTVGFISHMDTSPAVSGANVNVIIHKNYRGGDIVLPADKTQIISVVKNPILKEMIGDDIITADGTTLLGSDDKAGIAEIMTMIDTLRQNPQLKHGNVAIAFTPDEEVGGGIDKFDVKGFGAEFAYTVDGEELGEISNETWSARTATVTFRGASTHPGTAKGIMVNSAYAAADFMTRFPADMLPETTEGRVGFVHPYVGTLDVETSSVKILLRDFEVAGLDAKEAMLKKMVADTAAKFPAVKIEFESKIGYLNMKEVLKNYPQLTDYAMEAAKRAGLKPNMRAIRGGTDGSNLTFRNLPTPNLFTGGQNFHGKLEFNSKRGLEKSTETLVHLVQIYAEKQNAKTANNSEIDLTQIGAIAPKGRVQDADYNRLPVVEKLIKQGKNSIPFLIGKLEDETKIEDHVLDFWSEVRVGDVALAILSDFFTDKSWRKTTIPGVGWGAFLGGGNDPTLTGEQQLRNYIAKNGRKDIAQRWRQIWQQNKENIFWDETERCFRVKKT